MCVLHDKCVSLSNFQSFKTKYSLFKCNIIRKVFEIIALYNHNRIVNILRYIDTIDHDIKSILYLL